VQNGESTRRRPPPIDGKHYRPQLDGLRAVAILGVLISHLSGWLPNAGDLGVRLFFVLSGFLITSILLNGMPASDFYLRRAARLWPAFYLALSLALLLDLKGMRATWTWHAMQLTNLYFALHPGWGSVWPADHLWTLNVEVQFYLVWPLVIGMTPRKVLAPVVAALIVLGPLWRLGTALMGTNEFVTWLMPFAYLDALGIGALLALQCRLLKFGWLAAPVFLYGLFADGGLGELTNLASLLTFAWATLAASDGTISPLQTPSVVYFGRISYGVYLYHLFVLATLRQLGWPSAVGWQTLLTVGALTVVVAASSYHFVERPIRDAVAGFVRARRTASPAAS
jgi:peptidoglycan/LPS O-acetylase OafA/YrhL